METKKMAATDLPYWGVDLSPENRPGVPREAPPHPLSGAHWAEPARQPIRGPVITRVGLTCPTPVFSTALPLRGVSGALRRMAYGVPDHRVRHWVLLILADRVDVVQDLPSLFKRRVSRLGRRRGRFGGKATQA